MYNDKERNLVMKIKSIAKNIAVMLAVLTVTFAVSVFLQNVLDVDEHITTVFVFAVFLVSLMTDGYAYGIVAAFLGMIAVNFAFTFPYFALNFSIPENAISALVMIIISLMTSALTTKLKRWQEIKAEGEREKMRANLLRAVSHDLRTPLTTIYGSSSAILDNFENLSDKSKQKMIAGIKEDSQWLVGMVENLLSITRIDSGAVKLIKTPVVLEELIDSVIIKFKKRYPDKRVEIEIPDELLIIPMDPILIEQVIINMLENAVHHALGMTKITLRITAEKKQAIFEVIDDGCGIDNERLGTLFTAQMPSVSLTGDNKSRNAGIGLSVCASIIKAHGGSIHAGNSKDGGAIVSFSLDISEKEIVYEQ